MIRDFRVADSTRLFGLLQTNFPEEERIYGTRPEAWSEIIQRIHRPSVRLLVGVARLFRRPIYRFFTIEDGGQIVATSLVSFVPKAGYISTVMVDPAYRRRGYARRLLARCHQEIASFGRPHAVLDVLSENAPARALYQSDGYRMLRSAAIYRLDLPTGSESPDSAGRGTVRAYRPSDRAPLGTIAERTVPPEVARILPSPARRLDSSPTIEKMLDSRGSSWVLEEAGRPTAWVAATVSEYMEAAAFASPIVDESADPGGVHRLLATAIRWCQGEGARRIISRIPADNLHAVSAVRAEGFASALSMDTLYRTLP